MAYIGKAPGGTGVRQRYLYTATSGQTTFTTSDSGLALSYSDTNYMDVYQNGVLLDPANDYTATSGTSVVLGTGATTGDVIEIIVYDVFSVFNNTVTGNFTVGNNLTVSGTSTLATVDINAGNIDGTTIGAATPAAGNFTTGSFTGDVSFGDNDKAIFGAGSDLKIFHTGSASVIQDSGDGSLFVQGENQIVFGNVNNIESYAIFNTDGAVQLRHDNSQKFTTTSTGIDVTGTITSDGLTVDGNTAANGTIHITQASSDNQLKLQRTGSNTAEGWIWANSNKIRFGDDSGGNPNNTRMCIETDTGNVGIGTSSPDEKLHIEGGANTRLKFDYTSNWEASIGIDGAAGALTFENVDGSERMRIDSNGNTIFKRGADVGNIIQVTGADTTSETLEVGITGGNAQFTATHAGGGSNTCGITFRTRGGGSTTERLRIQSGGGISFNGDTAAANALDDYEEGTWTPGIDGVSYATADGHYIKIGNKVHCIGVLVNASSTVTTANALFTGLPFTVASDNLSATSIEGSGFFHYWGNVGVAVSGINLAPMQNTTTCNVYYVPAGGVASGNISTSNRQHFDASNVSLRFNITYFTD